MDHSSGHKTEVTAEKILQMTNGIIQMADVQTTKNGRLDHQHHRNPQGSHRIASISAEHQSILEPERRIYST